MSANLHYASNQGKHFSILESSDAPEAQQPMRLPSTSDRFTRQLVSVLISILILLHLLTGYVYWAKI